MDSKLAGTPALSSRDTSGFSANSAERGRQVVDLLVKVWLKNGRQQWMLLHVEVQHARVAHFAARLYRYNYRAFDVYGRPVITLAVLADAHPHWRPNHYEIDVPGTRLRC